MSCVINAARALKKLQNRRSMAVTDPERHFVDFSCCISIIMILFLFYSFKRKPFENQYKLKIHWFLNEKQVHKTILKVFLEISFPFPYIFLPFRSLARAFSLSDQ